MKKPRAATTTTIRIDDVALEANWCADMPEFQYLSVGIAPAVFYGDEHDPPDADLPKLPKIGEVHHVVTPECDVQARLNAVKILNKELELVFGVAARGQSENDKA